MPRVKEPPVRRRQTPNLALPLAQVCSAISRGAVKSSSKPRGPAIVLRAEGALAGPAFWHGVAGTWRRRRGGGARMVSKGPRPRAAVDAQHRLPLRVAVHLIGERVQRGHRQLSAGMGLGGRVQRSQLCRGHCADPRRQRRTSGEKNKSTHRWEHDIHLPVSITGASPEQNCTVAAS